LALPHADYLPLLSALYQAIGKPALTTSKMHRSPQMEDGLLVCPIITDRRQESNRRAIRKQKGGAATRVGQPHLYNQSLMSESRRTTYLPSSRFTDSNGSPKSRTLASTP
jgi:hypothetical protein